MKKLSEDFEKSEQKAQNNIMFHSFTTALSPDWNLSAIQKFWDILEGEPEHWDTKLLKVTGEMDKGDIPHIERTYHRIHELQFKHHSHELENQ